MKKSLLIILLSVLASGIIFCSFTLWCFQYQTGMPLIEVFQVKNRCEFLNFDHCVFVYYFLPENEYDPPKPMELEIPDSQVL